MNAKKILAWIGAARPQTLPAAFAPIFVGASLAYHEMMFRWDTSAMALLCAFLIQIGTNFANDYYDFVKGADTAERKGFKRASSTGEIPPSSMKFATFFTMGIAFVCGMYLVYTHGIPILIVGISSILFGILYTGGPYPLAYNGLGDIFVFIFFGLVAVSGTYYVNTTQLSTEIFLLAVPVGALCTNILVVNNLRDIETDAPAGKRTLGVMFGANFLKFEYVFLQIISFAIPVILVLEFGFSSLLLSIFALSPIAIWLSIKILTDTQPEKLNPLLGKTAQFLALFSVFLGSLIILS